MTVHFVAQYVPALAGVAVGALTGYVIADRTAATMTAGSTTLTARPVLARTGAGEMRPHAA